MVLFHVQHLLGSGHLQRIRLIAEALSHEGVGVTILSGGFYSGGLEVEGVEWVQLEPVRSRDVDFSALIDSDGNPVTETLFDRRREVIDAVIGRCRPQLLVIESWPFGRRPFAPELLHTIRSCRSERPDAGIVVSIRDILQHRSSKREAETVELLKSHVNTIMVHGDPHLVRLGDSFRAAEQIEDKIHYTGYVAPAPVPRELETTGIVVASGGGAAGDMVYRKVKSVLMQEAFGQSWTILVASPMLEAVKADFSEFGDRVSVQENRADFRELLAQSALLIGQAGYNTMMDVLVTGVPFVAIPFEGSGETEQLQRSELFELQGICITCRESADTGELINAIQSALQRGDPGAPQVELAGAVNSALFLTHLVKEGESG